ncbi:MAG: hypothetical protein FWB82_05370 [Treponema sp.]|nr:hypothetical protein [Treponema sp.]
MRKLKVVSIVLVCFVALVFVSCPDVVNVPDELPWGYGPPPDGWIGITVTGIPSRYHGSSSGELVVLNTDWVPVAFVAINYVRSSTTVWIDVWPGTFHFAFYDGWHWHDTRYPVHISAGMNTIT